jgi:formylglycine-generating enzyme required for sulfatase activity
MQRKGWRVALLTGVALVVLLLVIGWVNREHIRFFLAFESLGKNAQGYPEYCHRNTGVIFVRLPGGEFWMGTSKEEGERLIETLVKEEADKKATRKMATEWVASEQPRHKVTLSSFLVAKYEVSQAEWMRVMGNNPSKLKGENLPVERISWEDCQEFCRKTGLSLPSEAQWEFACRAGTSTQFSLGEKLTKEHANFGRMANRARRLGTTVPVDSFEPNRFGLYNMHGNVMEWCVDVFDPEFYKKPEASRKNPIWLSGSEYRVIRGGSWFTDVLHCRSSNRRPCPPSVRIGSIGFRPSWNSKE